VLPSRLPSNALVGKLAEALFLVRVVVRGRIELPTFRFSGGRSYRLSYLTSAGPALADGRTFSGRGSATCPGGPDGI
jgi:hypothetical protein